MAKLQVSSGVPLANLFNDEIGGAGVHGGVAASLPLFFEGELDAGIFAGFDIDAPGSFLINMLTIEAGYYTFDAVTDLTQPMGEFQVLVPALLFGVPTLWGPSFTLAFDHSGLVGGSIGLGLGFGWRGGASYTSTISLRHGGVVGWDDL